MRLSEYIKKHSISVSEFATQIGAKSRATVYRYINSEDENKPRIPDSDLMKRIAFVTNGQVTADDFYNLTKKHSPQKNQVQECPDSHNLSLSQIINHSNQAGGLE